MRLDIQNPNKLIGSSYYNMRFVCTDAMETDTNYRFQFRDTHASSARFVWIEISRRGERDNGKWIYKLNYLNANNHYITANWLSDYYTNVYKLMGDCLKKSL
jgi:hypothetical protein